MNAGAVTGVEINISSGGSAEPALDFVAEAFQKQTGHSVKISYHTAAQALKCMQDGVIFDVVVTTKHSLETTFAGKVDKGAASIGRAGLGVMIRPGAPTPNVSSPDALQRAVVEAERILYTTEPSGVYIAAMLKRMGVYDLAEPKTLRYATGPELMNRVLRGSGNELAFLSINAIRTYEAKGMVLVGPLPKELQHYHEFVAAPATDSLNKELAWEFVRFCVGAGKPLLTAHGLV